MSLPFSEATASALGLFSSTVQKTPFRATKSAVCASAEPTNITDSANSMLIFANNLIELTVTGRTP